MSQESEEATEPEAMLVEAITELLEGIQLQPAAAQSYLARQEQFGNQNRIPSFTKSAMRSKDSSLICVERNTSRCLTT